MRFEGWEFGVEEPQAFYMNLGIMLAGPLSASLWQQCLPNYATLRLTTMIEAQIQRARADLAHSDVHPSGSTHCHSVSRTVHEQYGGTEAL